MFKAIVKTHKYPKAPYVGIFDTEQEAIDWINHHKETPGRTPSEANYEGPINLLEDASWVREEIRAKRKNEYPTETEVIEALLESITENKPGKLNAIIQKRQEIKEKYPLG